MQFGAWLVTSAPGYRNGTAARDGQGFCPSIQRQVQPKEFGDWDLSASLATALRSKGPSPVAAAMAHRSAISKYKSLFRQMHEFANAKTMRYLCEFDLPIVREFCATWTQGNNTALKKLERVRYPEVNEKPEVVNGWTSTGLYWWRRWGSNPHVE